MEEKKSNKKIILIILIVVVAIIIIAGILGIYVLSKQNNNNNNVTDNNTENNQDTENNKNDWTNDYVPEQIEISDSATNGACYNLTVDQLKTAITEVLAQNNISDYQETSDDTIYLVSDNNLMFNIQASIENGKISNIAYWYGKNDINNIKPKEICDKIIMNIFEERYAQELIETMNELPTPGSKYSNYTLYVKMSYNEIFLDSLDDETRSQIEPYIKDNDMDMIICTPMTEEKYLEYSANV